MRAWTTFVEQGDAAAAAVRPEILRSWERSGVAITPDVTEAPIADESDTAAFWQDRRCRSRSSGSRTTCAAPPRTATSSSPSPTRDHAHPVDVRRPGDATQGRVGQLRRRRPLGRDQRRHERPGTGLPPTTGPRSCSAPSTIAPIVHNWVCWAAPVHDPVTGERLGVIDLSTTWDRTHPIGLATARVMARLLENAMPSTAAGPGSPGARRAGLPVRACADPAGAGRGRASTASGCCSPGGRPRSWRCSRCTPRGWPWSSCTRCCTATSR